MRVKLAPSCVALIPARAGSERIPRKNVKALCGQPLIAYTLAAALESRLFSTVAVSTDCQEIAETARTFGAERIIERPPEFAASWSPDIEWVTHALHHLKREGLRPDCFSILRPTSPFRSSQAICRAWEEFLKVSDNPSTPIDSLRAVRRVREHPFKMWRRTHPPFLITPFLERSKEQKGHDQQYRFLQERYGELFVQDSSLEVAWARVVDETRSISGWHVTPFFQEGYEGFSLDTAEDWEFAEWLVASGKAGLPAVPWCDD